MHGVLEEQEFNRPHVASGERGLSQDSEEGITGPWCWGTLRHTRDGVERQGYRRKNRKDRGGLGYPRSLGFIPEALGRPQRWQDGLQRDEPAFSPCYIYRHIVELSPKTTACA